MYLEDAIQSGVDKETAADFALTPTAVGGAGVKLSDNGVAQVLAIEGTGRWMIPEVTREEVEVYVPLGRWVAQK